MAASIDPDNDSPLDDDSDWIDDSFADTGGAIGEEDPFDLDDFDDEFDEDFERGDEPVYAMEPDIDDDLGEDDEDIVSEDDDVDPDDFDDEL